MVKKAINRPERVQVVNNNLENPKKQSSFPEGGGLIEDALGLEGTIFGVPSIVEEVDQGIEWIDSSHGQVYIQGVKGLTVQSDKIQSFRGQELFLPAKMSGIPWPALEAFYRAFWIILAAALGLNRVDIKYMVGGKIQGKNLFSASAYKLSGEDEGKLNRHEVRERIKTGVELICERFLWVTNELSIRYPDRPDDPLTAPPVAKGRPRN